MKRYNLERLAKVVMVVYDDDRINGARHLLTLYWHNVVVVGDRRCNL